MQRRGLGSLRICNYRQDEDIFQLARNINVGFFATVVLKDYVAAILNTPRAGSDWWLDLGAEIKHMGSRVERGTGNVVSTEFAVLYHWHAALSAADDKWMESVIRASCPHLKGKSIDEVGLKEYGMLLQAAEKRFKSSEPKDWTFNGLKRGPDGRFSDVDLGEIIKDCIEEPAHAFGAHGTPASLKVVDIMGQIQAREKFNVCTLNEFRKYLNLVGCCQRGRCRRQDGEFIVEEHDEQAFATPLPHPKDLAFTNVPESG